MAIENMNLSSKSLVLHRRVYFAPCVLQYYMVVFSLSLDLTRKVLQKFFDSWQYFLLFLKRSRHKLSLTGNMS